jgi:hypothetical protein
MKLYSKMNIQNLWLEFFNVAASISTQMYRHSYKYILFLWTIFTIMEFVRINYAACIVKYHKEFSDIEFIIVSIFMFLVFQIFMHMRKFKNNDEIMIDKENTELVSHVGGGPIKYLVIPIYSIAIFSLSKVTVYLYNYISEELNSFLEATLLHFSMWVMFFFLSFTMWYKVKQKAEKKWDFAITFTVIAITSVQLFWSSFFLPLTYGIMDISECIGTSISKEYIIKNTTTLPK